MRKYLKTKEKRVVEKKSYKEVISRMVQILSIKNVGILLVSILGLFMLFTSITSEKYSDISLDDEGEIKYLISPSVASVSMKRGVITIPTNMVKANPFLPYRDIEGGASALDVPEQDLVPPSEMLDSNSDAARVMDTIVSGILFDKYSPSAILNIEGSDYLVKKNDVVNGYKVLNIARDSVTVKLGSNVYKAGIGEILTEGELNYNEVSNLSNKFGGIK